MAPPGPLVAAPSFDGDLLGNQGMLEQMRSGGDEEDEVSAGAAPQRSNATLKRLEAVAGWAYIDSGTAVAIEALLSGPTNGTSAHARKWVEDHWLSKTDWMEKYAYGQAMDLMALVGMRDVLPLHPDADIEQEGSAFHLGGFSTVPNFPFDRGPANARVCTLSFADGQVIYVVEPSEWPAHVQHHTPEEVAEAVARVPKRNRSVIRSICLEPQSQPSTTHKDLYRYMSAGSTGDIRVYPIGSVRDVAGCAASIAHETGHTWSRRVWGNDTERGGWVLWRVAMQLDRDVVSEYARTSMEEDLADTLSAYVGTKGEPAFSEYQRMVPHRFKILDSEFGSG